jgi:hypothetical protein
MGLKLEGQYRDHDLFRDGTHRMVTGERVRVMPQLQKDIIGFDGRKEVSGRELLNLLAYVIHGDRLRQKTPMPF